MVTIKPHQITIITTIIHTENHNLYTIALTINILDLAIITVMALGYHKQIEYIHSLNLTYITICRGCEILEIATVGKLIG